MIFIRLLLNSKTFPHCLKYTFVQNHGIDVNREGERCATATGILLDILR